VIAVGGWMMLGAANEVRRWSKCQKFRMIMVSAEVDAVGPL